MPGVEPQDYAVFLDWQGRKIDATVRYVPAAEGHPYSYWSIQKVHYGTGETVLDIDDGLHEAILAEADRQRGWVKG